MGEYAYRRSDGERIKIGTCESMYYLRADQIDQIERSDVDPARDWGHLLYRFPFPWEDHIKPGDFEPFTTWPVWSATVPEGVDHNKVQFASTRGYNTMLPCPETGWSADGPLKIHRNGFRGPVQVAYQRVWEGKLVTVAQCGGCEAAYRHPTREDVEPLVVAIRSDADRCFDDDSRKRHGHEIADRILAGYLDPPEWAKALGVAANRQLVTV